MDQMATVLAWGLALAGTTASCGGGATGGYNPPPPHYDRVRIHVTNSATRWFGQPGCLDGGPEEAPVLTKLKWDIGCFLSCAGHGELNMSVYPGQTTMAVELDSDEVYSFSAEWSDGSSGFLCVPGGNPAYLGSQADVYLVFQAWTPLATTGN